MPHATRNDQPEFGRAKPNYGTSTLSIRLMVTFLLGVLSAVLLGVVVDLLTGSVSRGLRTVRLRLGSAAPDYDSTRDGLYALGEWSPSRTLDRRRLVTTYLDKDDRPAQSLVDPDVLRDEVASRIGDTGNIAYITNFKMDHRESDATQHCRVTLAPSEYSEVRAIESLRFSAPEAFAAVDDAVRLDAGLYVRGAVPSSVAINVIPVSEDGHLLCAQRSAAVDNGIGLWTVGIFETMKRADANRPGESEDFFRLGERALKEELGLDPGEYGPLHLTWLGVYRPLLRGHLVAIVRLNVSRASVVESAHGSDSSYEHAAFDWLRLDRATLRAFMSGDFEKGTDAVGSTLEVEGRRWLEQSRLGIREAWRFRLLVQE